MANVGSLKTLVESLQASALLTAVSATVQFGEESIYPQLALPCLVIVPVGGPWSQCGYAAGVDQDINGAWTTTEQIDLYLWAVDVASSTPIDSVEAVEAFRALVLQALMALPATGLRWTPVSGQWVTVHGDVGRYGRAYKLSIIADITVTDQVPVDATVTTVTLNPAITH